MSDQSTRPGGEGPRVTSVVAALAILRHLAANPAGLGVNAVARTLGLSPSSCFNVLKTLAAERFVDFQPASKRYTLGPDCVAVARRALDPADAFAAARADLERLADQFQLTSALWRVRRGERLILLGFAESEAATRIHMAVGQRLPIFVGAAGRCAAAFGGFDRRAILDGLRQIDWADAPSGEEYLADLEAAHGRGWTLDRDRFMRGVTTIGAPVLDEHAELALCVTSTIFSGQYEPADYPRIGAATVAAARLIADRLFGSEAARRLAGAG